MNIEAMIWSGVWGLFTAIAITPAFGLDATQNIVTTIIGALVISIAFRR
jgi:hypothetical protein